MKYYIITQEYSYPDDAGFLPVTVVEEGDENTPEEEAKLECEAEAKYVKEEYNVDVTVIKTATGYAFHSDNIHYRCEIIERNTNF